MDDLKRVSVVDDMAVQAYITLRGAILAMQRMYQDKADAADGLFGAATEVEDRFFYQGAALVYEEVANDIGRILNAKGSDENDKV